MLSAIVQKVTGQTVLDYLTPRLFEPLGIDRPTWVMSPQGITAGAYGLSLRTEDIARFGQLYLQKGMWKGRQLVPAQWVEEATTRQTANGSSPNSDWDQGYGYQFWRSRHNTYRGRRSVRSVLHGAAGVRCGRRHHQRRPRHAERDESGLDQAAAGNEAEVPSRECDRATKARNETGRFAGQTAIRATEYVAGRKVSGKWFTFPENDRGLQAVSFDFNSATPVLTVRTKGGESKTTIGIGSWSKTPNGFANGLDKFLSVPDSPLVAAAGAWSADDVFSVKLVLYQTPFYSALTFKFAGEQLLLDAEHNVSFGPRNPPQLVGQATR